MEVDDILAQVDILEYISQYCDFEEKNGEYWALSPLKEERTPSFSVNTEKQSFYDFSSGVGGNLIHFIRKYNDCGFIEAVNILKKYANITDDSQRTVGRLKSTKVARKFNRKTSNGQESKPTVLPKNFLERYEKREDKLSVWINEGISMSSLNKFDVYYDSFAERLVYPIRNQGGDIINIGGRTIDPKWKEKGLRKYTYYFNWNNGMDVVYGIFENKASITENNQVIVFEGAKSVMLADTYGIQNTCAILTSHFSFSQMKRLVELRVGEIVFALDKDVDINKIDRLNALKSYAKISYIYDNNGLLDEKDAPVDKGKDVFIELLNERRSLS